jgi:hypothetical protein
VAYRKDNTDQEVNVVGAAGIKETDTLLLLGSGLEALEGWIAGWSPVMANYCDDA